MARAIFFDRDGVINDVVDRGDDCFVQGRKVRYTAPWRYDEFRLKEEVEETLKKLKELGFLIILVTNQPDVAYGTMPAEEHERIMADVRQLPFDDIFVCAHGREDGCECKKPKPGMILRAGTKYNIDLPSSFFVGDSESDLLAGLAADCKTILFEQEYNKHLEAEIRVERLRDIISVVE